MATSTREETWTACLTFPKVPSPSVLPISYLPTCFLAAMVVAGSSACGATAAETDALAGWEAEVLRRRRSHELRAPLGELARVANTCSTAAGQPREPQRLFLAAGGNG